MSSGPLNQAASDSSPKPPFEQGDPELGFAPVSFESKMTETIHHGLVVKRSRGANAGEVEALHVVLKHIGADCMAEAQPSILGRKREQVLQHSHWVMNTEPRAITISADIGASRLIVSAESRAS
jgi:hypothetical protein